MIFTSKNTEKLYRGKSSKRLFHEKKDYERLTSPQNKKLFSQKRCQESNNRPLPMEKTVVKIDKKFGKPTTQVIVQNDKKLLLPAEFNEKYNKKISYHKHS